MNFLRSRGKWLLAAGVPLLPVEHDIVSKDTKTYKSFVQRPPSSESGWERVKDIFKLE